MDNESRDRLLRSAWELSPFEQKVQALSEIANRIGPDRRSSSPAPIPLPYTLWNLAAAARRVSWARGGGATTLPGKVVLQSAPRTLRLLARRMPEGCIIVSGTNGKTTTASMIAAVLRSVGLDVVHNRAGSNGPWGVATAMLEQRGEIGVFEVDEAWLPIVAMELAPRVIVLGNLFRDRLDGYGELDALATAWRTMLRGEDRATLVLNADDAVVANLGSDPYRRGRPPSFFFGVEDRALGLTGTEQAVDSIRCPVCEEPLHFDTRLLSHLGHYRCDACGNKRPRPAVRGSEIVFDGISGSSFSIEAEAGKLNLDLRLPGLYNVYNALAAASATSAIGIERSSISRALSAFVPVFGRGERIRAGATTLMILLMKNPAGANELLRTLSRDASPRMNLLMALNDEPSDGRDVSWIWDADFEVLRHRIGQVICSGRRAAELALRLKYADWPVSRMVVDDHLASALDRGLRETPERLVVLPTYSALLDLHIELERRGLVGPYWA
jgi:lipid II isoglutaminyl synthase (glutamine-hydrolysing)